MKNVQSSILGEKRSLCRILPPPSVTLFWLALLLCRSSYGVLYILHLPGDLTSYGVIPPPDQWFHQNQLGPGDLQDDHKKWIQELYTNNQVSYQSATGVTVNLQLSQNCPALSPIVLSLNGLATGNTQEALSFPDDTIRQLKLGDLERKLREMVGKLEQELKKTKAEGDSKKKELLKKLRQVIQLLQQLKLALANPQFAQATQLHLELSTLLGHLQQEPSTGQQEDSGNDDVIQKLTQLLNDIVTPTQTAAPVTVTPTVTALVTPPAINLIPAEVLPAALPCDQVSEQKLKDLCSDFWTSDMPLAARLILALEQNLRAGLPVPVMESRPVGGAGDLVTVARLRHARKIKKPEFIYQPVGYFHWGETLPRYTPAIRKDDDMQHKFFRYLAGKSAFHLLRYPEAERQAVLANPEAFMAKVLMWCGIPADQNALHVLRACLGSLIPEIIKSPDWHRQGLHSQYYSLMTGQAELAAGKEHLVFSPIYLTGKNLEPFQIFYAPETLRLLSPDLPGSLSPFLPDPVMPGIAGVMTDDERIKHTEECLNAQDNPLHSCNPPPEVEAAEMTDNYIYVTLRKNSYSAFSNGRKIVSPPYSRPLADELNTAARSGFPGWHLLFRAPEQLPKQSGQKKWTYTENVCHGALSLLDMILTAVGAAFLLPKWIPFQFLQFLQVLQANLGHPSWLIPVEIFHIVFACMQVGIIVKNYPHYWYSASNPESDPLTRQQGTYELQADYFNRSLHGPGSMVAALARSDLPLGYFLYKEERKHRKNVTYPAIAYRPLSLLPLKLQQQAVDGAYQACSAYNHNQGCDYRDKRHVELFLSALTLCSWFQNHKSTKPCLDLIKKTETQQAWNTVLHFMDWQERHTDSLMDGFEQSAKLYPVIHAGKKQWQLDFELSTLVPLSTGVPATVSLKVDGKFTCRKPAGQATATVSCHVDGSNTYIKATGDQIIRLESSSDSNARVVPLMIRNRELLQPFWNRHATWQKKHVQVLETTFEPEFSQSEAEEKKKRTAVPAQMEQSQQPTEAPAVNVPAVDQMLHRDKFVSRIPEWDCNQLHFPMLRDICIIAKPDMIAGIRTLDPQMQKTPWLPSYSQVASGNSQFIQYRGRLHFGDLDHNQIDWFLAFFITPIQSTPQYWWSVMAATGVIIEAESNSHNSNQKTLRKERFNALAKHPNSQRYVTSFYAFINSEGCPDKGLCIVLVPTWDARSLDKCTFIPVVFNGTEPEKKLGRKQTSHQLSLTNLPKGTYIIRKFDGHRWLSLPPELKFNSPEDVHSFTLDYSNVIYDIQPAGQAKKATGRHLFMVRNGVLVEGRYDLPVKLRLSH